MKKSVNISRDKLENLIESFFGLTDKYDIDVTCESLTEYIACKLRIDEETVTKAFGKILAAAASFNESAYNNAIVEKFSASEIQQDFMKFFHEKELNEAKKLCKDELMKDEGLKTYRRTNEYRSADQEGKYRMIWKYVVSQFNNSISSEEDLADVCMEIAMYDESQF